MSWYEYSVDDSAGNQVSVLITMGKTKVATSLIMQPNLSPDFESYSVQPQFRGKGFAYALTHLMLLYCDSKNKNSATCNNAHGHLIETLKGVEFMRNGKAHSGADAARFFYVMRSHEQHLDFDLDLAKSHSVENPVYYLQYTHARLCGLFRQAAEKGLDYQPELGCAAAGLLVEAAARDLLQRLMNYPEDLEVAVANRAPHLIASALREVAALFNSFYNDTTLLVSDDRQRAARLSLADAVRRVLASGLGLLGVSAPETM